MYSLPGNILAIINIKIAVWHQCNLETKESGLECSCTVMPAQWWLHCASQWGQPTQLSEHVYCVAAPFKLTEQVEQQIYIKFFIRLKHSFLETIWMIHKAAAKGNWWFTDSFMKMGLLLHSVLCRGFLQNIKSFRWLSPTTAQIWHLQLLDFPQTKIIFEK